VTAPVGSWRARVNQDASDFARDRVEILLAVRDHDGVRLVLPVQIELGEPTDPHIAPAPDDVLAPWLTLPGDAARVLFDALAAHFLGTSDVVRLSRDLAAERRRVDALIAGIGRMGASSSTSTARDVSGG
jgi:hypothetical protein